MTDFEKKMHHDGRLYGWAMLIAICAFPFFASVRSGIWPDFKIIWPGVLTMWILMASYVLSEMIAFPPSSLARPAAALPEKRFVPAMQRPENGPAQR